MNRGLTRILALGLAALVAACSTKPVPAPHIDAPPPAIAPKPRPQLKLYDREAEALAAYPAYARRDGGRLIAGYNGRDLVRLTSSPATDCEGWETCSLWRFAGLVGLAENGEVVPFIVLARDHGEGVNHVIIDRAGKLVWTNGAINPSPDGRVLASGETASLISDGYMQLVEWTPSRTVYESTSPCEPVAWPSPTRLTLKCSSDDEGVDIFGAVATRQAGGGWKIAADKPADAARLKPVTIKTVTASQARDMAAWESKEGVEHLP